MIEDKEDTVNESQDESPILEDSVSEQQIEPEQSIILTESQMWIALVGLFLFGWLLYLLSPVMMPFVTGAVLAYLGDPLVDRLEARKIPRTMGVIIVFVILTALIVFSMLLLLPMIERQLVSLYQSIPAMIDWVVLSAIPWIKEKTGLSFSLLEPEALRAAIESQLETAGSTFAKILSGVGSSSMAFAGWVANIVLIPVVAFYLMRDWDILVQSVQDMLPRKKVTIVSKLVVEMDEVLGAFLRGQLFVMFALGSIYSIGLWIVGLNVALIIGMVAGLASIVPYLGFIVGIVAAIIAAMIQFGDITTLVYVLIVFGVGQVLESVVLTPLLVGDKIGLHPVAVIFAIMAGGQLFGFVGILVALPVGAIIMVLLRHMNRRYKSSTVYSDEEQVSEPLVPDTSA